MFVHITVDIMICVYSAYVNGNIHRENSNKKHRILNHKIFIAELDRSYISNITLYILHPICIYFLFQCTYIICMQCNTMMNLINDLISIGD